MDVIISKNLYSVCYNVDIKVDLCMSYWIQLHILSLLAINYIMHTLLNILNV